MGKELHSSRRIALNTLYLYLRMLLVMVVTLYTSRVVLHALGVVDFGIFNAVGGIVAMLGFLSSSMSNAVQRYLSFEMGCGATEKVGEIFNASFRAHIIIAVGVLLLLEIAGLWFLNEKLSIPEERMVAARWVFHCSVFAAMFSIIQVPYNALIIAKEEMGIYAYISIIEVLLKLGIVFPLLNLNEDRLIVYSILMAAISVFIVAFYIVYCLRKYKEARLCRLKSLQPMRELMGFAGWNVLGEIAWIFTGQGVNLLLNVYFGPIVNAARGIAYQVDGAVSRFVSNFQTALNPQIIKTYAANEHDETLILLYRGTRFSFFLLLLLSLPLIFEMNFILSLWLVEVPDLSSEFCQIILITSMVTSLSNLLATVAKAYGKIRNYQIVISTIIFLNFPISFLMLNFGYGPLTTAFVALLVQFLALVCRMFLLKKMIVYSIFDYIRRVIVPLVVTTLLSSIVPLLICSFFKESISRFALNCTVTIICTAVITYYVGLPIPERKTIFAIAKKYISKWSHHV